MLRTASCVPHDDTEHGGATACVQGLDTRTLQKEANGALRRNKAERMNCAAPALGKLQHCGFRSLLFRRALILADANLSRAGPACRSQPQSPLAAWSARKAPPE